MLLKIFLFALECGNFFVITSVFFLTSVIMEFLKALHDAESYGVSREVFIAAWERESQLMQAKEDARVMELKHSLNMSNHEVS